MSGVQPLEDSLETSGTYGAADSLDLIPALVVHAPAALDHVGKQPENQPLVVEPVPGGFRTDEGCSSSLIMRPRWRKRFNCSGHRVPAGVGLHGTCGSRRLPQFGAVSGT